jgi:oxidoreductase domain protein
MDHKFRAGIVGCGNIFPMHAYPISKNDNVDLVAVCDIKQERADAKAKEFSAKAYYDYQEMIEKENLDVIHICLPHYLHPIVAEYAFSKGLHVMTEKPMSIYLRDAKAMIEAAEKSGRTLGVIFQNRYNNSTQLIYKALRDGRLGKVKSVRMTLAWCRSDEYYSKSDWKGTWDKEGGGVIIDQAIHTLDLMRYMIGEEIEFVDCSISNRAHEIIEVEDAAEGVIKFQNGIFGAFHCINYFTYDAPVELEFDCEKGRAKLTADKSVIYYHNGDSEEAHPTGDYFHYGNVKSYWGVCHQVQINQFYDALKKGEQPEITCYDALKTQQMVCAMYESGKLHKRVYLK